ncbi:hypothetical protein [Hyalangium gracile]|uniref:hypothetical protein n=1 Tax=Hyalangium gracile TaxID=394092 RepID=UPI001CCC2347|nr:hypothetical protein [Hyalangium gracile]
MEAVVVVALAVAIAAAVLFSVRWWYTHRVPTEVHVLVPEGRRVMLRAGNLEAAGSMGHLTLELPPGLHEVELLENGRTLRRVELQAPTKTHRVLLPVGRQCFALYPRESMQPLQVLESEDPVDLEVDLVFNESERPALDSERRPGQPAYETEKRTWLLVKPARCGAPGR